MCEPQSVGVFPFDHRALQKGQQCFAVEEQIWICKYMRVTSCSLIDTAGVLFSECITVRTLQAVTLGQNYSRVAKHCSRRELALFPCRSLSKPLLHASDKLKQ